MRATLFFGDSKEATARKLTAKISKSSLAFGGLHFLDPTCTYNDLKILELYPPALSPHPPLTKSSPAAPSCLTSPWHDGALHFRNHS
jgi:hypothetical protein